jgi:photosystem II stability/assembly factor-like uncharacterized protein
MIKDPAFVSHRVTFMKKIFWTRSLFFLVIIFSNSNIAQTWEKLNPIFFEKDTLLQYATINFVTKNVGWIETYGYFDSGGFRSILLETKDGGISWKLKWELKKSISIHKSFNLYTDNSSGEGGMPTFKLDTNNIWFMGFGGGLLFSKDMGLTWDTSSVTLENIYSAGYIFTALYFFNDKNGIAFNNYRWFTSDGGYTWTKSEDTLTNFLAPTDVYFLNDSLGWMVSDAVFDATDVGSIVNTTNGGRTWAFQRKRLNLLYGVAFIDSLKGYAVGGGLYKTKDGGKNWENYSGIGSLRSINFLDNLYGWIGGAGKILRTTDGGESWETQVEGLESNFKQMIILKKDKVAYALGTDRNGKTHTLLRADLSNLTEVKSDIHILPEEYKLFQNYPNPFNPSTFINYQIPSNGFVTLKVYDVLGNEATVLVNEWKEAGSYNAQFTTNGKQLASGMSSKGGYASGVYFYTLTAGKFTDTKKFILMK